MCSRDLIGSFHRPGHCQWRVPFPLRSARRGGDRPVHHSRQPTARARRGCVQRACPSPSVYHCHPSGLLLLDVAPLPPPALRFPPCSQHRFAHTSSSASLRELPEHRAELAVVGRGGRRSSHCWGFRCHTIQRGGLAVGAGTLLRVGCLSLSLYLCCNDRT